MQSLVLELQHNAADGSKPLPDVLRKARMVASKLSLEEINIWIGHELHGYTDGAQVPSYRVLHGDVRAHNPYNGVLMPVRVGDPATQESLSVVHIRQSAGSLYDLVTAQSDHLQVQFSHQQLAVLQKWFGKDEASWMIPFRRLAKSQISEILDAVRSRLLDWTLELENNGILGEGMTFTQQEKQAASSMPSFVINASGGSMVAIGQHNRFSAKYEAVANSLSRIKTLAESARDLNEVARKEVVAGVETIARELATKSPNRNVLSATWKRIEDLATGTTLAANVATLAPMLIGIFSQ